MKLELHTIGTIHSPFLELENMPIQPGGAQGVEGVVEVLPEFADGLKDLDGFNFIYLLYVFHCVKAPKLRVVPFMDSGGEERGVFSTRTPLRPNPIGMSLVELVAVEGNRLRFLGVDILDGTPLLDIKPFIQHFDRVENPTSGWMTGSAADVARRRSDTRFIQDL
jgi:tRNA-Thr(GGU) m(6)t(6)A37 methyltransferase TsaA